MTVISVKTIIGAHAYACITHDQGKLDIRLAPGKSQTQSLLNYAGANMEKARQLVERAMIAKEAAQLDRGSYFHARPIVMGFLSVALADLPNNENDAASSDEREAVDVGTIYDCPDETYKRAIAECDAFEKACQATAESGEYPEVLLADLWDDKATCEQIGSDLYMERAGHGVGFTDRIWSDDKEECDAIGSGFSALVKSRGSLDTYVGDDGKAYFG